MATSSGLACWTEPGLILIQLARSWTKSIRRSAPLKVWSLARGMRYSLNIALSDLKPSVSILATLLAMTSSFVRERHLPRQADEKRILHRYFSPNCGSCRERGRLRLRTVALPSRAAPITTDELQKPCQRQKCCRNNVLAAGWAAVGQKAPFAPPHPAKNSCPGGRGKYLLTIPA